MGRVVFPKGKQTIWINQILKKTKLSINDLAKICKVSSRTIRDWRREKFTISEDTLLQLNKKFNITIPSRIKYLKDYWYVIKGAKKGALKRMELYGPPGTLEGRRKGGIISQLRREQHPELYPNCISKKKFIEPKKSSQLAELVGIILGDGGITSYQLKISLNKETEPEYIKFVSNLLKKTFGETPTKYYYSGRAKKVCILTINGINLIKVLHKLGLKKGNKILLQVSVPKWIENNHEYSKACLRGLIDTDGCVYYHKHKTRGFSCYNIGLTLTNHSRPLVEFAHKVLLKYGFASKLKQRSIYLYREKEVIKYFNIIKSHNAHNIKRLEEYLEVKNSRRSTQVVDEARLESV